MHNVTGDRISTAPKVQIDNQVDVWIQDQTTQPFHMFFMTHDKTDITLISGGTKGEKHIYVSTDHGFSPGDVILLIYQNVHYQCISISSGTNEIILGMPLPIDFPISGTTIIRGKINMNVNGSVTPVIFYCNIGPNSVPVDIQTINVYMEDNSEGDDSLYGGLPSLTNGCLGRFYSDDGDFNLGLFRKNGNFIQRGAVQNYTNKAGGGNYSMTFNIDFKLKYGIVIRLDNKINSYITYTVNDDLTGLITHHIITMGQTTQGE